MKVSNLSNLILFGLILTIPAVGRRKKPGFLTPLPGARAGPVPEPGPAPSIGQGEKPLGSEGLTGIKSNDPSSHQGWIENAELFKADTVHFDFDSSVVKSGEKGKVAKVADYLKGNSDYQRDWSVSSTKSRLHFNYVLTGDSALVAKAAIPHVRPLLTKNQSGSYVPLICSPFQSASPNVRPPLQCRPRFRHWPRLAFTN